jgi:hypothetical protein
MPLPPVVREFDERVIRVMRCIAQEYNVPLTEDNARTLWLVASLCEVFEKKGAQPS